MKKVLFVCYGSGHVRMVVPVARALRDQGLADVEVMGLTTAASVVRDAGLPLRRFGEFLRPTDPEDARALALGRELVADMLRHGRVDDPDESAAYLGSCHAELIASVGEDQARQDYARLGRQAYLPVRFLERVLRALAPDLVVTTNSPRAERAAILAAGRSGIPAVCMVDLFAVDEVRWIGAPNYAQRVCVLNESVREFLVAAGRRPQDVVVTGNPAFDGLWAPEAVSAGRALREAQGWAGQRVVLWPLQAEPAVHPFDGRAGDPSLPARVLSELLAWVHAQSDAVLCVRARAGDEPPDLPLSDRVRLTGQDWPLVPLLHATDVVVTLTSTVGLEGHLAGARLLQVSGSVFDDAMPLKRFGIADSRVPCAELAPALDAISRLGRREGLGSSGGATSRLVAVLRGFLDVRGG